MSSERELTFLPCIPPFTSQTPIHMHNIHEKRAFGWLSKRKDVYYARKSRYLLISAQRIDFVFTLSVNIRKQAGRKLANAIQSPGFSLLFHFTGTHIDQMFSNTPEVSQNVFTVL